MPSVWYQINDDRFPQANQPCCFIAEVSEAAAANIVFNLKLELKFLLGEDLVLEVWAEA